jgi:glycosyltransferase involved in cell wall biosynthesis
MGEGRMKAKRGAAPVSVVMPVYNALPYLDEAVESILGQSMPDFEFVIYDDGSTDGSYERLQEWADKDSRIQLVQGKRNLGPGASSNAVVRHASAPLIARMDADDISKPGRLQAQVDAFAAHPDAGIVGSLCETMDSAGKLVRGPEYWRLTRKSWFIPFPHGSIMFRRTLFDALGGYREECEFWEDLDLVLRASRETRIFVIPRALYRYRQSNSGTRLASKQERVEAAMDLRYRAIDRVRQGRGYKDLLSTRAKRGQRVDPRVSVSLGLLSIWSGHRPKLVRRFLERSKLGFDKNTMLSAAAVLWMSVSPATLRAFVNGSSALRNALVRPKCLTSEPLEWRPPNA